MITPAEFERRYSLLQQSNKVLKSLFGCCFRSLPPSIKSDALRRMNLRRVEDEASGMAYYEDVGDEPGDLEKRR